MSGYTFSMTHELHEQLTKPKSKLPASIKKKFAEIRPLFQEDPFHPALERTAITHAIESDLHATHLQSYRMVWKRIHNEIILLYIDQHDPAYFRAKQLRFRLNRNLIQSGSVFDDPSEEFHVREEKGLFNFLKPKWGGRLFSNWSDKDLLRDGVPDNYLQTLRAMNNLNDLKGFRGFVPDSVFDKLFQKVREVTEIPVIPPKAISDSLAKYEGGVDLVRFANSDEFKQALEGNMEDWMLFLTHKQRKFVHINFAGPARVRGVAGSGKTVVAVHRARVLAQRHVKDPQHERVLFLTYGNRLPDINMHLLKRLTNNGPEVGVIECRSVYSWVGSLLHFQKHLWLNKIYRDRNVIANNDPQYHAHFQSSYRDHEISMQDSSLKQHEYFKIDEDKAQLFLQRAIESVQPRYPDLKIWERSLEFFEEEIRYRIKGHDVRDLETYLELPGTGRGTPLHQRARRAMFEVFESYEQQMKKAGIFDFEDLILCALDYVEPEHHKFRYVGAVVDEIQDLTAATMKLIRKMVPEKHDDLFLVGDGAQRIYPGGYNLSDTGIYIKNRGSNLRFNYRNTEQIMRLSNMMLTDAVIDDMDEEEIITNFPNPSNTIRTGDVPVLHRCLTPQEEILAIASEITDLRQKDGFEYKDFAILYRIKGPYKDLAQQLLPQYLKCPVVEINDKSESYFGPGVKITTLHSAKGLEFKVVFIVGVSDHFLPFFYEVPSSLDAGEQKSHIQKERALLYVGLTRARDFLYLTYPQKGGTSRFLESIPEEILCRLE